MSMTAVETLRRKFILVATLSFFFVILIMGGATALANYSSMRAQADRVISVILDNDGELPHPTQEEGEDAQGNALAQELREVSPEFLYATRYFSVTFDANGEVTDVNVSSIATVGEAEAVAYAEHTRPPLFGLGSVDTFFFREHKLDDGGRIEVYLDCATQMQINREVLSNTMLICGASLAITFLVVVLTSSRAIRPEIENARKQRQFVTNASHELKTPLAVIRANTEVIEMLQGESEWTQSTRRQVDRMDGLVQNLVMIARAEEREDRTGMSEVDVTKTVSDSVAPFQALAKQDHLELISELEEGVRMVATESSLQQLCTLLVDNAIKYCDKDGQVRVSLSALRKGKAVQLVVSNTFAEGESVDYSRFFERFYRDDEAHSDQGGYGIGLSVAESICTRYQGTIKASWKDGVISFTCQLKSA